MIESVSDVDGFAGFGYPEIALWITSRVSGNTAVATAIHNIQWLECSCEIVSQKLRNECLIEEIC